MGARVVALMLCPAVYLCRVSFCGGGAVSSSSSCWVWGRLLLSLFWCVRSAFFLGLLRFSAVCHAVGYPSRVPHLADSGWLTYCYGGRLAWGWGCLGTGVLIPHLGFLSSTGVAPPSAASL